MANEKETLNDVLETSGETVLETVESTEFSDSEKPEVLIDTDNEEGDLKTTPKKKTVLHYDVTEEVSEEKQLEATQENVNEVKQVEQGSLLTEELVAPHGHIAR